MQLWLYVQCVAKVYILVSKKQCIGDERHYYAKLKSMSMVEADILKVGFLSLSRNYKRKIINMMAQHQTMYVHHILKTGWKWAILCKDHDIMYPKSFSILCKDHDIIYTKSFSDYQVTTERIVSCWMFVLV